jgi:K+-transporting ATPase ATPase C chain
MKTFLNDFRRSVVLTVVFGLLLCGAFPLAIWGAGQLLFPKQANGSLITDTDGTLRGSALLGQSFTSAKYFHSRASAAGSGYDATSSGGTNLGPTSQKLADSIKAAIANYRAENNLAADVAIPADAVTSSGSGLDPHISVANAHLQAARVATARALPLDRVRSLIAGSTNDRDWRLFGEPTVNVLILNRALDALK